MIKNLYQIIYKIKLFISNDIIIYAILGTFFQYETKQHIFCHRITKGFHCKIKIHKEVIFILDKELRLISHQLNRNMPQWSIAVYSK